MKAVLLSVAVVFTLAASTFTIILFYVIKLRRRKAAHVNVEPEKEVVCLKEDPILTSQDLTSRCSTEFVQMTSDVSLSDIPFHVPQLTTTPVEMTSAQSMLSLSSSPSATFERANARMTGRSKTQ